MDYRKRVCGETDVAESIGSDRLGKSQFTQEQLIDIRRQLYAWWNASRSGSGMYDDMESMTS